MNLDELKKRTVKVKAVTLKDGSEWHIRKLSASVGIAISKAFMAAGHTDPDGPAPSQEQLLDAYSLLLSKAVCDEHGALSLDSEDGRLAFKEMDFPTVQELSDEVQQWSLSDDSKKN